MTDKPLKLLGLMRRAGAVEIGADRSTEAARAGKARVLLLASDLELPFSREELSEALGVGDCTMAAVTEIGFAEALVKQLADEDAEHYAAAAEELKRKHEKMQRRKSEKGSKGQAKKNGMRRTNI